MNTDFTYCTGTGCPIKTICNRYSTEDFSTKVLWMNAEFDTRIDRCVNFINK